MKASHFLDLSGNPVPVSLLISDTVIFLFTLRVILNVRDKLLSCHRVNDFSYLVYMPALLFTDIRFLIKEYTSKIVKNSYILAFFISLYSKKNLLSTSRPRIFSRSSQVSHRSEHVTMVRIFFKKIFARIFAIFYKFLRK